MLDFGITAQEKMEDYNTRSLPELVPGDEISGEIVVGEFKTVPMGKREVAEFYVVITDHENREKWVCEFVTPYSPETDNIYGENGGLFYTFMDSLNHAVNNTPLNWQENYSVNFTKFRNRVNEYVSRVTVQAVPAVNPQEKTVILKVLRAQVISPSKTPGSISIYDIAQEDPIVLMAYTHLRNKGERRTVKNIRFELKALLDDEKITEHAYQTALEELKIVKDPG
jgi:hypothetical protein